MSSIRKILANLDEQRSAPPSDNVCEQLSFREFCEQKEAQDRIMKEVVTSDEIDELLAGSQEKGSTAEEKEEKSDEDVSIDDNALDYTSIVTPCRPKTQICGYDVLFNGELTHISRKVQILRMEYDKQYGGKIIEIQGRKKRIRDFYKHGF